MGLRYFLWGLLWPNFLYEKATAPGFSLQYQLAVSAFFVLCRVLKRPYKVQKSTHRCAAIFAAIPAPRGGKTCFFHAGVSHKFC
jgi:hypothetical protein